MNNNVTPYDIEIISKVNSTFIKKELTQQNNDLVHGAIISACSKMAKAIDEEHFIESDIVSSELLEIYGLTQNEEIKKYINLPSIYIKQIIGYSVDLEDYSSARATYERDKVTYDSIYDMINKRNQEKAQKDSLKI